jgi:RimJ/RimL family protein N-acetyltransferase
MSSSSCVECRLALEELSSAREYLLSASRLPSGASLPRALVPLGAGVMAFASILEPQQVLSPMPDERFAWRSAAQALQDVERKMRQVEAQLKDLLATDAGDAHAPASSPAASSRGKVEVRMEDGQKVNYITESLDESETLVAPQQRKPTAQLQAVSKTSEERQKAIMERLAALEALEEQQRDKGGSPRKVTFQEPKEDLREKEEAAPALASSPPPAPAFMGAVKERSEPFAEPAKPAARVSRFLAARRGLEPSESASDEARSENIQPTGPPTVSPPRVGPPPIGPPPGVNPTPVGPRCDFLPSSLQPLRRASAPTLRGAYCTLSPLDPASHGADLARAWDLSAESAWTYLWAPRPQSSAATAALLEGYAATDDPLHFAVCDAAHGGAAVGTLALMRVDMVHGVCELGHINFTSPLVARSRVATEAVALLLRFAFCCGFRRVEWKCDALNAPSVRAAKRYGFTQEGVFREHMVVKGRLRDTAWFSMLVGEWAESCPALERWLAPSNFDETGKQRERLNVNVSHCRKQSAEAESE